MEDTFKILLKLIVNINKEILEIMRQLKKEITAKVDTEGTLKAVHTFKVVLPPSD